MSNPVIIHISDLHVTEFSGKYGINPNTNTLLDSNLDNRKNITFIKNFTKIINENFKNNKKYLIITGDLTQTGEEDEFISAEFYVKIILEELKIEKEDLIIVPGDHDVHRPSLSNALRVNKDLDGSKDFELNEIKFKNFSKFYENITGENFLFNNVIFKKLILNDQIAILGLNSNEKVGIRPAYGYIDVNKFEIEFKIFKSEYPKIKNIFVAFHHNISGIYENNIEGQWTSDNRKDLKFFLYDNNIKFAIYGNEHTHRTEKLEETEIVISDSGALSSLNPQGTFKCYEMLECTDSLVKFKNNLLTLDNSHSITETGGGDWDFSNIKNITNEKKFEEIIFLDNKMPHENSSQIPPDKDTESENNKSEDIINEVNDQEIESIELEKKVYDGEFSEKLYDIVKRKKLFHSGHFHWSESSRAHNWIDVTKLLECKEDADDAKDSIIDVIETFKLNEECDLIVGIGYEGNIIASKPAIKYNINYSFLPYSYRYDGHNPVEKQINFTNEDSKFKTVMIITDVVNDGRTIKKLIESDENIEFFKNVKKIIVISLFYTGQTKKEDFNFDIMNANKFNQEYKIECSNNIEYYTVTKLRVEKCDYENVDDCFIYKHKLNCVHLFYDEKS